jgi:hypothetical protein
MSFSCFLQSLQAKTGTLWLPSTSSPIHISWSRYRTPWSCGHPSSEGTGFKSLPGDRLSWLWVLMGFLSPSGRMSRELLKSGKARFLTDPNSVFTNYAIIARYTFWATDSVIREPYPRNTRSEFNRKFIDAFVPLACPDFSHIPNHRSRLMFNAISQE